VDDRALYFTWHRDFSDVRVMGIVEGDDWEGRPYDAARS
jgi:hypothetical protein